MTTRTTRRTRLLAAVATTTGALALTLLPTTAAQAVAPPAPKFAFIDNATLVPSQGAADGTGPTDLAPDGYRAYDLDVTPSGDLSVMSLCNGTVAACTDTPTGSRFDGVYGVVLVHNDGSSPSRLLTNLTNTNPVITRDGLKVMWIYANTLHTFLTATETYAPTVAIPTLTSSETPFRLAASDDGANIAVMFGDGSGTTAGRVLGMSVASGKTAGASWFEKSYPSSAALRPNASLFGFVGASTLVYDEYSGVAGSTRTAVKGTLSVDNLSPAVTALPALQDYYRLRQDASSNWWAWKDLNATDSQVANFSDPLVNAPVVELGPTRNDGGHTYGYTPSTAAPGAFDATPTTGLENPAVSHLTFSVLPTAVAYNGRAAYATANLYGGLENGAYTTIPAQAAESDRGVIDVSLDGGSTWAPLVSTSGASVFVIGRSYYNGYLSSLRRTTVVRWHVFGQGFVTDQSTSKRTIVVTPNLSVKVTLSGASRIVSGAVTRPAGTMVLYRQVSTTKYAPVASVKIVRTSAYGGTYSFGKRHLVRGNYKVVTWADTYAGTGVKAFKI